MRGQKSVPPVHCNVTDFHCNHWKNGKKETIASTSILSFWGRGMIKISRLGIDYGEYWLNADLLGLTFNKISKVCLPF